MIKDEAGAIVREEAGAKAGEGTRWTFVNEGEAAKQRSEWPAAELAAAPKALRDRITAAAAVIEAAKA